MSTNIIIKKLYEVIAHLKEDGDPHGDIPKLRYIIEQLRDHEKSVKKA